MRLVTGRSSKNSTTKTSIRLTSGGRFFSASTLSGVADSGDITITVDTTRCTLIPSEMVGTLSTEQILSINGLAPHSDEVVVVSDAVEGKVAIIAIAKSAFDALSALSGVTLHFTSPLLSTTHSTERAMAIEICDEICYIRLYNDGLKVAEALTISSTDELLYYVANILDITECNDIPIYIIGSKDAAKKVKKYYKVICE